MKGKFIGIAILILVIIGGVAYKLTAGSIQVVTLKGYIGGEKQGLFEDEEVQSLLESEYGVIIDYSKAGSIEMVQGNTEGMDFLFPSSQVALELFKEKQTTSVKSGLIFSSPIVLYSWDTVTDTLEKEGIVTKRNESYYIHDFPKLIKLITDGSKWSDIGLQDLYGSIMINTTDPTKSNSGTMFAGLLASMLNKGEIVDETTLEQVLPTLIKFYAKLGYMESSSSDLFEQYLKTGMGANPLIAGYENQAVEFSINNPEAWKQVKSRIRILYPEPTVWSEHPLIALNANAEGLMKGLQNESIQKIAWERYGFRTGMIGVENDPHILDVAGIPGEIKQVIAMPKPRVMEQIIEALQQN